MHFPSTLVVRTNLCFAFSNSTEEGHNGVLCHPFFILTGLQRRDCSTNEWSNHPWGWGLLHSLPCTGSNSLSKVQKQRVLEAPTNCREREMSCCEDSSRQPTKSCSRAFTVPSLAGWQMQRRKVRKHAKYVPCQVNVSHP